MKPTLTRGSHGEATPRTTPRPMRIALVLGSLVLAGVCCAAAAAAAMGGGSSIATAPVIQWGHHERGDTADGNFDGLPTDYWNLHLIARDRVRIDWSSQEGGCCGDTYAFTDVFSIYPSETTDSTLYSAHELIEFPIGPDNKAVAAFTAPATTGVYPVLFECGAGCASGGPFQFTAHVWHRVILTLRHAKTASNPYVEVLARYADGRPINRAGLSLSIYGKWAGQVHLVGRATPKDGTASVKLQIPPSEAGKTIALRAVAKGPSFQTAHTGWQATQAR